MRHETIPPPDPDEWAVLEVTYDAALAVAVRLDRRSYWRAIMLWFVRCIVWLGGGRLAATKGA